MSHNKDKALAYQATQDSYQSRTRTMSTKEFEKLKLETIAMVVDKGTLLGAYPAKDTKTEGIQHVELYTIKSRLYAIGRIAGKSNLYCELTKLDAERFKRAVKDGLQSAFDLYVTKYSCY